MIGAVIDDPELAALVRRRAGWRLINGGVAVYRPRGSTLGGRVIGKGAPEDESERRVLAAGAYDAAAAVERVEGRTPRPTR